MLLPTHISWREVAEALPYVFRYAGIYTAKVLSAVSKMNQVIDYGVAEEGSSDRKTFAGYIRATKVCPECGKPLQLKKSQKKKGHYGVPHKLRDFLTV